MLEPSRACPKYGEHGQTSLLGKGSLRRILSQFV